jgi:hypothetical protein
LTGFALLHVILHLDLASWELTDFLIKNLMENSYLFATAASLERSYVLTWGQSGWIWDKPGEFIYSFIAF